MAVIIDIEKKKVQLEKKKVQLEACGKFEESINALFGEDEIP